MMKTKLLAVALVGLTLSGCAPGWTYSPVTMTDGFATEIRHTGTEIVMGPFGPILVQEGEAAEILMPDGAWVPCPAGECGAIYVREKDNHPAPPVITARPTNPKPVEKAEKEDSGGSGGGD
ncbi:MAG TPA: hypothetical protein VMY41_01955 [Thermohalobaculum sp.]|nr:hypothetical protein [Thermohalobaculum sp.]